MWGGYHHLTMEYTKAGFADVRDVRVSLLFFVIQQEKPFQSVFGAYTIFTFRFVLFIQ